MKDFTVYWRCGADPPSMTRTAYVAGEANGIAAPLVCVESPYPAGALVGFDTVGNNIRSFTASDASFCQSACATTQGCAVWAWGIPSTACSGDHPNACYLKSAVSTLAPQPCRVWGRFSGTQFSPSPSPSAKAVASGSQPTNVGAAVGVVVVIIVVVTLIVCCCCPACRRQCCGCLAPRRKTPIPFPLSAGPVPPGLPFAPDSTLRWGLVRDGALPIGDLISIGTAPGGQPEYLARARLADGSLRPGRAVNGAAKCSVACECVPLHGLPVG